jgi:predicted DCC family thiol-disulfide oxidoreductase YuxK
VEDSASHPVLLYDGVCGLCNRTVQFVLRHDRRRTFRFAALQSPFAARVLARYGAMPSDLDTFYVIESDPGPTGSSDNPRLYSRSDAALFVLREIGGFWRFVGGMLRIVPRIVRDWAYRLVARNRYHIFGHYDTCPLPDEATRHRFLDD